MIEVSVVIPSIRKDMLLESMASVLNQTQRPKDIIVWHVNDMYFEKFITMMNLCRGDAVLFLGDDDKLDPTFIEKTAKRMEETNADIVHTDLEYFGERGGVVASGPVDKLPRVNTMFITSLIRKSVWDELGGMDPTLKYCDWDFFWSCYEKGKRFEHVAEPLFKYRIHRGQDSYTFDSEIEKNKVRQKHGL